MRKQTLMEGDSTKKRTYRIFGGLLLVGTGVLALLQAQGYIGQLAPQLWIALFAVIGLAALVVYALSGCKDWGWLFPAGIAAGLDVTLLLTLAGIDRAFVGTPIFIGLLIPFVAAYLSDRARHWWALIPGGIMLFLALTTLLADLGNSAWIGALSLLMLALGFLAAYLEDRRRRWAGLVAYIFGVLSLAPLMSIGGRMAELFGPVLLLAIAAPFLMAYWRSAAHWWAIIPAGVLTTSALIATLAIAGLAGRQTDAGYLRALFMGGLAATFAMVGWRQTRTWARVVAVVLLVMGVASLLFVQQSQMIGALAIIVLGIYLLVSALRPRDLSKGV